MPTKKYIKKEAKEPTKKMREKERRDNATTFPHLCILSTMIFMIESLSFCHHHIASGKFSLYNLACIFQ